MNKKGFSIAEMMVVMLILSIVLAAATPIITKRVIARANEATEQPSSNPTGSIIAYAGVVPPDGWLLCNGQSTAGHPELAAIVGANVPDLRGEFIRGWDNGRGVDSGRTINSFQMGSMVSADDGNGATTLSFDYGGKSNILQWGYDTIVNISDYGGDAAASSATADSPYYYRWSYGGTYRNYFGITRPRNIALNYIIKY